MRLEHVLFVLCVCCLLVLVKPTAIACDAATRLSHATRYAIADIRIYDVGSTRLSAKRMIHILPFDVYAFNTNGRVYVPNDSLATPNVVCPRNTYPVHVVTRDSKTDITCIDKRPEELVETYKRATSNYTSVPFDIKALKTPRAVLRHAILTGVVQV